MSAISSLPDYDFSGLGVEKQTIGIIMVCIGAYLLLFGKKYFKVFLGNDRLRSLCRSSLVRLSLLE